MKYQDFSSDENLVSSEDSIFILRMWRYHGCYGSTVVMHHSISPSEGLNGVVAFTVIG